MKSIFQRFMLMDLGYSLIENKIIEKCFKKYQSNSRFLIIVLMRERGLLTAQYFQEFITADKNLEIDEKLNIKFINFIDFLRFLGLKYDLSNFTK